MSHSEHTEGSTPKKIWKTFWILLIITVAEIFYALVIAHYLPKYLNNSLYAILSIAKAGFIISEFMHMKYEVKNLIRTVGIPCLLLLWLITALVMEGNSWRIMRDQPMPAGAEMEHVEAAAAEHH